MPEAAAAERCRVPDEVLGLVCHEITEAVGVPDGVLELWAERGQMLPRVVRTLRPRHARALVSSPGDVPEALRSVPGLVLGTMDAGEEAAQVVLGVPPWRWATASVTLSAHDGPVRLRDDPAYARILRACTAMPEDGVAAVVVGLGFLARRGDATVGANLERFGVHVTGVVALPRGMFLPASGPGRVLLILRRRPSPPVVGRLEELLTDRATRC